MDNTSNNKKLVEQIFNDLIEGNNLSNIDKLIATGFRHHGIPGAKGGPDGFKETIQQFRKAFPDFKVHKEYIISEGNLVATWGHLTGTNKGSFMGAPASNKTFRVEYIDTWKIQNGQAVENWVQMDSVGIMEQLGLTHVQEHA